MEVVREEGDDGVSEGSGSERGDVRGVKTSQRSVGLVGRLFAGCEEPYCTGSGSERGDVREAKTSLGGARLVDKLAKGCKNRSRTNGGQEQVLVGVDELNESELGRVERGHSTADLGEWLETSQQFEQGSRARDCRECWIPNPKISVGEGRGKTWR